MNDDDNMNTSLPVKWSVYVKITSGISALEIQSCKT